MEETLRDIEARKRLLEEQYRAKQNRFEQQMRSAQSTSRDTTQPPRPDVNTSRFTSSGAESSEAQMARVRAYQRRALERQGDRIEQLRLAKENLQEKVCMHYGTH